MTRKVIESRTDRARALVAPRVRNTLDARMVEAIDLFVQLLAQCGCPSEALLDEVRRACDRVPLRWVSQGRRAPREVIDATHALTAWFSDPTYLDRAGMPRPLPLHGAEQSLEALVLSVNHKLDVGEVLAFLTKGGALRRVGSRYVPRGRVLSLRGVRGPNEFRNLRGLLAMLRTFEHNSRPRRQAPSWFEFCAENPRIPKRACARYDKFVKVRATRFLYDVDAELRRLELTVKPGEPTVRLGTGVYRYEEDCPEEANLRERKAHRVKRGRVPGKRQK